MAAITIRQLPDEAKRSLRMRAAVRGTSMEAEARAILLAGLARPIGDDVTWIDRLAQAGQEYGDLDLPEVPDEPAPAADLTSL